MSIWSLFWSILATLGLHSMEPCVNWDADKMQVSGDVCAAPAPLSLIKIGGAGPPPKPNED